MSNAEDSKTPKTDTESSGNGSGKKPRKTALGSSDSKDRADSVFEVIVRQALAGAPWREINAGVMKFNSIQIHEVEFEVKRRQSLLRK